MPRISQSLIRNIPVVTFLSFPPSDPIWSRNLGIPGRVVVLVRIGKRYWKRERSRQTHETDAEDSGGSTESVLHKPCDAGAGYSRPREGRRRLLCRRRLQKSWSALGAGTGDV